MYRFCNITSVSILFIYAVSLATGVGGYRIRESHQLWSEILKKNLYKEEFLAYWRKLELDLCIAPCFPCPAPRSKDVAKITREFLIMLFFLTNYRTNWLSDHNYYQLLSRIRACTISSTFLLP